MEPQANPPATSPAEPPDPADCTIDSPSAFSDATAATPPAAPPADSNRPPE